MPYKFKNTHRHKFTKAKYRPSNWREYNASLKNRGRINIWFTDEIIEQWYHNPGKKKTHGRQKYYADSAINTILVLKSIFKQGLRQTQGFAESIVGLMENTLAVPDYSTISRRASDLIIPNLSEKIDNGETIDIAIDASGLKFSGPGEWLITKHGNKKKVWKKLHLAVNLDNQKIIASELTSHEIGDSTAVPDLLKQIDSKINKVLADTGYSYGWIYEMLDAKGITAIIPPRVTAILSNQYRTRLTSRDIILLDRCEHGIEKWQKLFSYNKRSLVETCFGRYKKIIGGKLCFVKEQNRITEIKIACNILNKMIDLGAAKSYKVKKSA